MNLIPAKKQFRKIEAQGSNRANMVNYLYKLMGSEAEITEKICCLLVTKIYLEKLLWKIAQIAEIIFYLQ